MRKTRFDTMIIELISHKAALLGARTRLEQIEAERAHILEAFPELAESRSGRTMPAAVLTVS